MIAKNTKKLTFITSNNFETVEAVAQEGKAFSISSNEKYGKVLNFLSNHRFQILYSFLDNHPLEAYHKLINYLEIPHQPLLIKHYQPNRCSFSLNSLTSNPRVLPYFSQLRRRYLNT